MTVDVTEQKRLNDAREAHIPWKKWGPYLSERQWGTVREDYSDDGNAWDYFTHDQARSRAYRWGEDGLGGICDDKQRLCFALALWNERDPILKERLFGLTNSEAQPRRGRQGVLLLPRQHADPLVHEVSLQVPAAGVSLPGPDRDEPETIAGRVRVRAARHGRLRRRPVFRRVRGVREGGPGRHPRPHHRAQSRARSGPASRPADALVPQHLVLGRRRAEAVAARGRAGRHSGHRTTSLASTGCTAMAPRSCSSPRTRAMRSVSGASPTRRPTSRMRSTSTSSRAAARRSTPPRSGPRRRPTTSSTCPPAAARPSASVWRPPGSTKRLRRLRGDLQEPDRRRRRILRADHAAVADRRRTARAPPGAGGHAVEQAVLLLRSGSMASGAQESSAPGIRAAAACGTRNGFTCSTPT